MELFVSFIVVSALVSAECAGTYLAFEMRFRGTAGGDVRRLSVCHAGRTKGPRQRLAYGGYDIDGRKAWATKAVTSLTHGRGVRVAVRWLGAKANGNGSWRQAHLVCPANRRGGKGCFPVPD